MRIFKSSALLLAFVSVSTTLAFAKTESLNERMQATYMTSKGPQTLSWMRPCQNADVKLTVDPSPDATGMSHAGVDLTIKNTSSQSCYIRGLPDIFFIGPWHDRLNVQRVDPNNIKTTVPTALMPKGAEGNAAVITLRWVSGKVFDHNHCERSINLRLRDGNLRIKAPVKAEICGEAGEHLTFEQTPLRIETSNTVK